MEDYSIILDYLPQGLSGGNYSKKEPVCYAIGDEEFKLFELVPKANATVVIGERGSAYEVSVKDGNKTKMVVARPEHLVRTKVDN